MGQDIHAHLEILWDGEWEYYAPVDMGRNYEMFTFLAEDSGRGIPDDTLGPARGLPSDISKMTQIHYEVDVGYMGVHHPSWIPSPDISTFLHWYNANIQNRFNAIFDRDLYLFGNDLLYFIDNPGTSEYPKKLQDVRLIFWFDN
jgi:hypothetical protein